MTNVLVITGDTIGPRMAGPAIRAWKMAELLSADNNVALMTTTTLEPIDAPFELQRVRPGEDAKFARLHDWAQVVVFQGHAMDQFAALRNSSKIIVADIYDPMHLEMLEQGRELGQATWKLRVSTATRVLNDQLARADFFLCASERQRLFYLGQLTTLGRVNPATYAADPHLERLISVAPFGLDDSQPTHTRDVVKGVREGIRKTDKLIIWGGGLYNWFDPLTLIRAVAQLSVRHSNVRLLFMGTKHPVVDEMGIVTHSLRLAQELGVLNKSVFFNESWVQFSDRQNWLLEADAGVSTHMSHVETTFAFRTRILDYLWTGLPMVVTEGDSFAELVETQNLGIVVPPQNVDALEHALERVLFDKKFVAVARANVQRVRAEFFWDRALSPLISFVKDPRHAADYMIDRPALSQDGKYRKPYGLTHNARMFWHYLRSEGPDRVAKRIMSRLRKTR